MKIAFIGGVGRTNHGHGGETIKNIAFLEYLNGRGFRTEVFDTVEGKKNLLKFYLRILALLVFSRTGVIVLSAATNTSCRFIKLSRYLNWHNKSILYFVIGGTLLNRLEQGKVSVSDLNITSAIYIESKILAAKLSAKGVKNCRYMPNFKNLRGLTFNQSYTETDTLRLLFLSRVIPSKGIETLIETVGKLLASGKKITLDIYGPADEVYLNRIKEKIESISEIEYRGVLNLTENPGAYEAISTYDCMVLPTTHYGEGFPGVFIDCFAAGLPVITTDWNYNSEIVENGRTGYVVPPGSPEELYRCLFKLTENKDELLKMRRYCKEISSKFDAMYLLNPIFKGLAIK